MKKYIALLGIFFTLSSMSGDLKIMTYNVWYGFEGKKNLDVGSKWIKSQDTDVLALQELKGFNKEQLSRAAHKWGHKYSVLSSRPSGFPLGLTSKMPIRVYEEINPGPGYRLTLHCEIAGIHYFVVHFNPQNYRKRLVEAAAVANKVKALISSGEKVIVLGDFNAHSRMDKEVLSSQKYLLDKWGAKEKQNKKFKQLTEKGEVDFSVMDEFFNVGLKDLSRTSNRTFPTKILAPEDSVEQHKAKLQRIDFILVSPELAKKKAQIIYPEEERLHKISDHYPVILDFK